MSEETSKETTTKTSGGGADAQVQQAASASTNGHSNGAAPKAVVETSDDASEPSKRQRRSRRAAPEGVVADPTSKQATAGAAPAAPVAEGLRLRLKIWTDPASSKRYLVPGAFMRDVVNGQPFTDIMYAYAYGDGDTRTIELRMAEWNALPFHHLKEDGPAPRAAI